MKTILTIAFTIAISISTMLAQDFRGIATYKTDRTMSLEGNKQDGMDDALMKQIQEQLKEQFRKEFTLTFTPDETLYKEVEKLDKPSAASTSGMQIKISGDADPFYTNSKEKKYLRESEIMGKQFLIEDSLIASEWKLEKESKTIGQYICFKATRTRTTTEQTFDSDSQEFTEVEKEQTTIAWYTPSIPVQHGPDEYYGLPGLILEIQDGELSVLCSKIILNPKDEIIINKPSKGKKVNQSRFDEIQKKKNDEMMEQFQNTNKRKNGNSRSIIIRG